MKPTQRNHAQRDWRARLSAEERDELALLEWQIGVNDVYRAGLAQRRNAIVNRASKRAPALAMNEQQRRE